MGFALSKNSASVAAQCIADRRECFSVNRILAWVGFERSNFKLASAFDRVSASGMINDQSTHHSCGIPHEPRPIGKAVAFTLGDVEIRLVQQRCDAQACRRSPSCQFPFRHPVQFRVQSAEQFIRGRAVSAFGVPDKRGNCGAHAAPSHRRNAPKCLSASRISKGQSRYPACPAHRQAHPPLAGAPEAGVRTRVAISISNLAVVVSSMPLPSSILVGPVLIAFSLGPTGPHEGKKSMRRLRHLLMSSPNAEALIFRSRRGGSILETTIPNQGLYPALKAPGLPQGGLHGFRRGCNRRSEFAGINPAVIRQQTGHSSHRMTAQSPERAALFES